MIAIIHLLSAVPNEFRSMVLNQLPFDTANFPLNSNAASINARRKAHEHFINSAQTARQLNCPTAAIEEDEYALWLELRDPENSEKGRQRLETKLRDPKSFLRFVPLGLQFGIKLDLAKVEREIERQTSLHGGITPDVISARFAIAFKQKTPEKVANYVSQHFNEPSKYIDQKSIEIFKIQVFSQAGLPEKANRCLNLLLEDGLPKAEEDRIRKMIAEAKENDPVKPQKERFKKTDSLVDLIDLVRKLESRQKWEDLCKYGEILFNRTEDVRNAEIFANALSSANKMERLSDFLEKNTDLLPQSRKLQMLHCWSLYHEGALLEARSELEKLEDYGDDPNYRTLQVALPIALGDWDSLLSFIVNEYSKKETRSASDLISVASLAVNLSAPQAKDLIFAAVQKGKDDAEVLAAASFLAPTVGLENDKEVANWLQKAAELSDNNGPVQKMAFKDIFYQVPEWEHRESEILPRLIRGEIPVFLAAQLLNKSFFDLTLFHALANQSQNDLRRRVGIPAYSGKRLPTSFDTGGVVGMDVSALLTLSFLDLLNTVLDTFDTVYIPHSTLIWLFEEKRNITFHQPSLIKNVHQIQHLFITNQLEKFVPSAVADSNLSTQVGNELARLIAEAEKARDNDDTQHIVVRSSPVYRITSLMEEEADLTKYADVMSGCLSIVYKLRQMGKLTAAEEKRACDYLQLHEKPWPNQPEIKDGATLYLDSLSITYFLHLGILEKLKTAGFRSIASPDALRVNELISYESISGKAYEIIESTRFAISSRIKTGKVKLGRQPNIDRPKEQLMPGHPSVDVLALAGNCDLIIADDRYFNQNETIEYSSEKAPIFSTLDLLETLTLVGAITPEDRLEYRTRLRQSGYFFMPVDDEELIIHLAVSTVDNNELSETAELKAIRESILHVRMNDWLQIAYYDRK